MSDIAGGDRIARDLAAEGFGDVERLEEGGFGVVYRARRVDFDQLVAVKVLTGHLDDRATSRLDRERRAMGALAAHPGIVTPYASGTTASGQPYIVMEYAPGGSLADRLAAHGPLPWPEVVEIAIKLTDALQAAHDAGVLHRDVKPENVLVSGYGEPMLADFGIARLTGAAHTESGSVTASLVHAAPEVLDGKPPTPASDIYSLSSTLYTLMTGQAPFVRDDDDSVYALIARIGREPPPDLSPRGIPHALCAVVERGLAKDPADRFASARELGEALEQPRSGRGSTATEQVAVRLPSPAEPGPKKQRRSRSRIIVAAATAFAVVASIAVAAVALTAGDDSGGGTSPSSSSTSAPTTTGPQPDDPRSYYTTDGSRPAIFPDCNGVFGLCLGSPLDAATRFLGREDERFEGILGVVRVWEEGPIRLTVEVDEIESIVRIAAAIAEDAEVALGLPERLVLGEVTMGDVKERLGEPVDTFMVEGENVVVYSNCFASGPEGSEELAFSFATETASASDPGGFNAALDASRVNGFQVSFGVAC